MKTKIYYYLPLDGYNQPNGQVIQIELTEDEFTYYKECGNYIYDNEADADWRAQC